MGPYPVLSAKHVELDDFAEESAAVGNDARGSEAMADGAEESGSISDNAGEFGPVFKAIAESEAVSDVNGNSEVVLDGAFSRCRPVCKSTTRSKNESRFCIGKTYMLFLMTVPLALTMRDF